MWLTRVTQNKKSLDLSRIAYWRTVQLKKPEKDSSTVLVPYAGRGVLDSWSPPLPFRHLIVTYY